MSAVKLRAGPLMFPREIAALRGLLLSLQPRRVLEWGTGGSTLYWPPLFPAIDWVALDHDPAYIQALRGRVAANVTLVHLPFPAYYRLRAEEAGTFDLIIVDGRERVRCLDAARSLLNPGGAAVLHDMHRARYAPARKLYRDVTVLCPVHSNGHGGLWLLREPK
jgi:predicted O-methyltransferase YrrM